MTEARRLAEIFLCQHPREAARELEALEPAVSAALLKELPAPDAGVLLDSMLARYASRCLDALPAAAASAVLRSLNPVTATIHLRSLPESRSRRILARMPKADARGLRLLLRYPASAVGAWMDSDIFTLPLDDSAGDAVRRARREAGDLDRLIYVVDRDQRLAGAVRAAELLRAAPETSLETLLLSVPHVLRARTALAAVRQHPGWSVHDMLPVLNRNRRFVGVLHSAELTRALSSGAALESPALEGSLMELVELSWIGMAQLLEGALDRLPGKAPRAGRHG